MEKYQIFQRLMESGVVAVMRKMTPEKVVSIVSGLKSAGITAVEITVEDNGGLEAIQTVKEHFNGEILIGAGTVLDGETAKEAINAGVDFIVTPVVSKSAIDVAKRYGCFIGVGAMTPTEILTAYEAGADLVKIFPADNLGPSYLKNVKGPLGHIPLMPTGGINLKNIGDYVKSGAVCVGVGGALYNYDTEEEIVAAARKFVEEYQKAKMNRK
ncbi:bifunctional 4-hydroxy-2-oxoglutarate aldolase/2-dehydro-3-deoxy-phosphogluconate aldolase [Schinkia azotoformans]|uniref:bifunctional 4-hydroxy-2-oxoglutarate aldolase/2-dehydro-3-deoxy-phosphogluconate aldolase n=1 Tax=Schinkia azotoformans TaxID=1454 RepID=UPI002DBD4A63|nr:bifunctional 4-hydroxy-2-oxoglutarate aldolase/2-dehydro-3-deoxy-phosphogluconate aldolase [Schinkia azotoformans]MEC1742111.1 bifunctional 4-hydroxy-2-oxoglutarate aldolase/2-dehydro-3-deoxy-phosphogluconate aldolase [Schinkia azotoformans]MEC1765001.1 bifunctional 4-hydroxy-2-oxoglutarate aldolase/2-dehydro-3-deoxy-phosphogluconate aldolase [Schinkia azotoformans]MEC1785927.1 bifunctional 4-hydroxy-2-oxoglutarate aldolase/2-dehydro-3-deoxy-phosphogluconate aldolase [Schinkia azotoformans]M